MRRPASSLHFTQDLGLPQPVLLEGIKLLFRYVNEKETRSIRQEPFLFFHRISFEEKVMNLHVLVTDVNIYVTILSWFSDDCSKPFLFRSSGVLMKRCLFETGTALLTIAQVS